MAVKNYCLLLYSEFWNKQSVYMHLVYVSFGISFIILICSLQCDFIFRSEKCLKLLMITLHFKAMNYDYTVIHSYEMCCCQVRQVTITITGLPIQWFLRMERVDKSYGKLLLWDWAVRVWCNWKQTLSIHST